MNAERHRQRSWKIGGLAASLLAVVLLLAWLERGTTIVIYNDGDQPLTHLMIRVGDGVWQREVLAPEESFRWRPPPKTMGALTISADSWDAARPPVLQFEPQKMGSLVLRLGRDGTVTSTTELPWWRRVETW